MAELRVSSSNYAAAGLVLQASGSEGMSSRNSLAKIGDDSEGVNLKVILYDNIRRRKVAYIWLPKNCMDKDKLIQSPLLQNPRISMDEWVVIPKERTSGV